MNHSFYVYHVLCPVFIKLFYTSNCIMWFLNAKKVKENGANFHPNM